MQIQVTGNDVVGLASIANRMGSNERTEKLTQWEEDDRALKKLATDYYTVEKSGTPIDTTSPDYNPMAHLMGHALYNEERMGDADYRKAEMAERTAKVQGKVDADRREATRVLALVEANDPNAVDEAYKAYNNILWDGRKSTGKTIVDGKVMRTFTGPEGEELEPRPELTLPQLKKALTAIATGDEYPKSLLANSYALEAKNREAVNNPIVLADKKGRIIHQVNFFNEDGTVLKKYFEGNKLLDEKPKDAEVVSSSKAYEELVAKRRENEGRRLDNEKKAKGLKNSKEDKPLKDAIKLPDGNQVSISTLQKLYKDKYGVDDDLKFMKDDDGNPIQPEPDVTFEDFVSNVKQYGLPWNRRPVTEGEKEEFKNTVKGIAGALVPKWAKKEKTGKVSLSKEDAIAEAKRRGLIK